MTARMKPTVKKLNLLADLVLKDTVGRFSEKELKQLIIMLKGIDLQLEAELSRGKTKPGVSKLIEEIRKDLA